MLTSLVVPSFADTAGTGVCQQTFTPSGNGTASVVVVESSGFCYVAFKNTGNSGTQSTFSWSRPTNVSVADVAVIGGGGGGGSRHGGGGGAGAFVDATSFNISAASSITIQVGGGGAGAAGNDNNSSGSSLIGAVGINSFFRSGSNGLTALGGGLGANAASAGSGGSGGGAGWNQTPGVVTTQAQTTFAGGTLTGITFGTVSYTHLTLPTILRV